jgi:succinate dehydrogenase/fumarate reductase flavoprotein subunit
LERKESRGGGAHVRTDYPERDDKNSPYTLVVEKEKNSSKLKFDKIPTDIGVDVVEKKEK